MPPSTYICNAVQSGCLSDCLDSKHRKIQNIMAKVLIAYYSRRGENYVNGSIRSLSKGNTEVVAEKIKALIPQADLFHIDTVRQYSPSYMTCIEEAKQELRSNARPEMKEKLSNPEQYDTIILGYPNWWGTMPMVCYTFLESFDTAGKTIIPFCTNEGSGMGSSERAIRQLCPKAEIKKGISIHGAEASSSDREASQIANLAK